MNFSVKSMLLPVAACSVIAACTPPYPRDYREGTKPIGAPVDQGVNDPNQQTITDNTQTLQTPQDQANDQLAGPLGNPLPPVTAPPVNNTAKPNYPTASPVPGKDGFVFNPYTHNVVDVRGIGSGKLVRDPEDPDTGHKFRVP
ncbi:hypothetical protein [Persicirhabdus sediminis]|uniref:Lipoprotein n=1 Tax=Persicirhabdus sediminis TaxID=454144 RepID=A0A8J7MDD4_9BACT|nr:hypothetical protein [Persicirhabdus sediminis]MBK1791342.1 hypothetical protein [Persicirhabdus sediminis]